MYMYRPISFLPSISKILENLTLKQFSTYLNKHELLYHSYYGFKAGHCIQLASIKYIDRINQDLDEVKVPMAIFLDLTKAFDTLEHVTLLQKINYYGIKSIVKTFWRIFTKWKTQYFCCDKINSDMYHISTGVPQGSILDPIISIIIVLMYAMQTV